MAAMFNDGYEQLGSKFGQVQKLTHRLNEILREYPCDDSILKELLQNSDDAGADEITFIYDHRQHKDRTVFCESWKQTLGPALCVYNNKTFTEDDLKGIQDLGIGSKSSNLDKTGQYGIGFNSVYHLTDCPSFLSNNDTLCILDPHCIFIDRATPDAPGYKYDIQPNSILNRKFADALSCFRLDCLPNVGGTVFRFPLRTREMNNYTESKTQSVISEEIVDELKIKRLLGTFKLNAFDMLLYLNNVKQIKISHMDDRNKITTDYWVKAELSLADEIKRNDFHLYVKECAKQTKLKYMKHKRVTYEMTIFDSCGKKQVWLVNQCIGSTCEIPPSVATEYDEGHFKLLPRGGVAACLSHQILNPSTYCFLPLPIQPNLPVSINGHFSLNHNRRDLSNITRNTIWNRYVMCEVIAPSYSQLLIHLREIMFGPIRNSKSHMTCNSEKMTKMIRCYWHYFPNIQNVHPEWTELAKQVFLNIVRKGLPLFPVVRRTDDVISIESDMTYKEFSIKWLPCTGTTEEKAYFCTEDTRMIRRHVLLDEIDRKKMLLNPILQQIGFNISNVPPHIYNHLNWASLQLKQGGFTENQTKVIEKVSPLAVVQFLKTDFDPGPLPCHIDRTSLQGEFNYTALLEYVDQNSELSTGKIQLNDLPLLLTQDLILRRFNRTDTYFKSNNHALLPKCSNEFLHESACCHFTDKSKQIKPFEVYDLKQRLDLNIDQKFNTGQRIIWNPDDKVIPNKTWINQVWDFLKDEFKNRDRFPKYKDDKRYNYIKEQMGDWAVFPVKVKTCQGVHRYLMPFSSADTVLESDVTDYQIKDALNKMALCVIDESVFPRKIRGTFVFTHSDVIDFVTKFIATAHAPQRVLKSLVSLLDKDSRAFNALDDNSKKNILLFFQRFVRYSLNQKHIRDLRRLPCYQSIYNESICLTENSQTFVLYSGIPEIEKERWLTSEADFIKEDCSLDDLHTFLGLTISTEYDVYKRFILPLFHKLSDNARIEHMKRINYKLQFERNERKKTSMMTFLKRTPLLAHPGKPLKRVSDYFDSSVEIFQKMLNREQFLPKPFNEDEWKSFMKELDLKTEASPEEILEFARIIERKMKLYDPENQIENSKSLVNHVANNEKELGEKFFKKLSTIEFLAPSPLNQDLLKLHRQYKPTTSDRGGIAFKGAVTSSNVNLVWTGAHILPSYVDEDQCDCILEKLHAYETPPLEIVLNHTKTLISNLNNQLKGKESRTLVLLRDVMRSIFGYFCDQCKGDQCEQIARELKDVPIMLVGDTVLIHPKNSVKTTKKEVNLTPYIYKIPEEFAPYMELFYRLGAQSEPSITQCCELLKMIRENIKNCSYRHNPNLVSAIKFAVRKIFKSFQDNDWLHDVNVLYLPNRSSQLMDSSTLKYIDKPMFEIRMDFQNSQDILLDLDEVLLENIPTTVPTTVYVEKMPTKLRPHKFSTDVKEVMCSSAAECKCPYAEEGLCQKLKEIQYIIHSTEFSQGIYRLLKHEATTKNLLEPDLSSVSGLSTEHLSIQCLIQLDTHFVRSGEQIQGTVENKCCFLDRQKEPVTLFLKHDDLVHNEKLKLKLANAICELTGVLDNMTVALILCCNLAEIQKELTRSNINLSDTKPSSMSLPDLGSPVPDYIVASLDLDPYNEFVKGEYVVYELDEYGEGEYVYARIIDEIGPYNYSLGRRYRIHYGHFEQEVSALHLYKWRSVQDFEMYGGNDPPGEESQIEELVPLQYNPHSLSPQHYGNYKETKNKLSEKLTGIWKMEEDEKNKAIGRLYLKWHPDKNPEQEQFCAEVLKHLKNEIDELEKKEHRQNINKPPTWESTFKKWDRRAGSDRQRREYYGAGLSSYGPTRSEFSDRVEFETYSAFSFCTSSPPRPMPNQAELWRRQAHEDLRAAQNDGTGYPSYEWVAYKCMQAAEKSLKAALLSSIGRYDRTHDIRYLSITVTRLLECPSDLRGYVDQLCRHGKNQEYCRYPSNVNSGIPHNLYDRNDAIMCIDNASEILNMMDALIAYNR